MKFNMILLVAVGVIVAGSADYPKTQNTGPISPGADYPLPKNAGPISPGADYPLPKNAGPISPGAYYPSPKNAGPVRNTQRVPIANGPAASGPKSNGPVSNGPASRYRPASNGPVLTGPFLNEPAYKCGANEVYQRCGVGWQCEDYCGRGANACAYCEDGCYCKPGYIRSGPEYTAKCIPKNQCPRAPDVIIENSGPTPVQAPGPVCGANEVYQRCGVGWQCEDYCGRGANACAYCEDGCYCKRGYIRSGPENTANCIRENQCPRAQDVIIVERKAEVFCEVNEVYRECGGCDQFCNREPVFCSQDCRPGCYCQKGYVRSSKERICIPARSCPAPVQAPGPRVQNDGPGPVQRAPPPQCRINEVYNGCGGCDQICNSEPIACKQDCSSPGCYCRSGFVRSFKGGTCIPRNDCPRAQNNGPGPVQSARPTPVQSPAPQCNINEVYNGCGACDQICNSEPIFCSQACDRSGCYCRSGFIRSFKGGTCIPRNDCPRAQGG